MAYDYLLGPVSMIRLKNSDKDVYLIGDYHETMKFKESKKNVRFEKYVNDFFLNSDKSVSYDYIAEFPFDGVIKKTLNQPMLSTLKLFNKNGCFSLKKDLQKQCSEKYPNVRFHRGDIRYAPEYKITQSEFKQSFFFFAELIYIFANMFKDAHDDPIKIKTLMTKQKNTVLLKDTLHAFKQISSAKKFKRLFLAEMNSYQIMSQVEDIDKKYKKSFGLFLKDYKKMFNDDIKKLDEKKQFFDKVKYVINTLDTGEITEEKIKSIIPKISKIDITITKYFSSKLMDIYVIARMLKEFKDTEHPLMTNIFIHAGVRHILNIKNVMIKYLNFEIKEYDGIYDEATYNKAKRDDYKTYQRISTKKIKLPLFEK